MCVNEFKWSPSSPDCRRRAKKCKVRVRVTRGSEAIATKREMELVNLKLYLENRCIIEENERLRRRAVLLDEENKALLSEMMKKSSNGHDLTTSLKH